MRREFAEVGLCEYILVLVMMMAFLVLVVVVIIIIRVGRVLKRFGQQPRNTEWQGLRDRSSFTRIYILE